MNEFFVLKLLDRLQGGFRRMGVDYPVLRSILQLKLTMDGRRTPTVLAGGKESKQNTEGSPFRIQWIYLLLGLVLIAFVVPEGNYLFSMSITFGIAMFMISTTLISDFSSVMLDLRDKNILFVRPVNRRTLNMAKSLHILIYLFTLTLTLMGPSLVFSVFKQGVLFFLIYAAEIILMDCLILVITGLIYLLILRVFDGEKLKDIINYVQIILSIGITVGYQLISRLFNLADLSISFKPAWWQYFLAPVWFASPFERLLGETRSDNLTVMAVMALVVPVLLLAVYIKLMPLFERSLQKLAEQGVGGKDSGRLPRRLSEIVCRSKEEAMFFRFTWSMMRNERDFKLKVYPTFGLSLILPFIFIFNSLSSGNMDAVRNSRGFLFIYFSALLMMTAVQMLRYSTSYKAAWIYKAIPIRETAPVYRGMLKAAVLRLLLPLFVIESAIFLWLFGVRLVPHLIIVLLSLLVYSVLCFRLLPQALPFSEKYSAARQKDFTGSAFVQLFILILFAGLHYLVTLIPFGIYIYAPILVIANWWLWSVSFSDAASRPRQIPTLRL
ncbi:hypothetical protein [Paenibacillus tianjinensis]|uniref:ABC-2 type transport system permease protein n=1 Tax=Paenibacillus tianjinensis TaxID=2810347 RepID=A0ABX7LDF2_9BACL|nr:hypothetical protein [Paenibacillus tianjinensis]QSF44848.1 hypothetical protein JRJ22_27520 [Paenibacillus tianjinensis]